MQVASAEGAARSRGWIRTTLRSTGPAASAIVIGIVIAILVVSGLASLAIAGAAMVAAIVALYRRPFVALSLWLLLTPFVVVTEGGAARKVFWFSHRALPLLAVAFLLVATLLSDRRRRPLPRLGLPEVLMAGYVLATFASVLIWADTPLATGILVYDRIVAPMLLYMLVRLSDPDDRELRWLVPILAFVLLIQAALGFLSWFAPSAVPGPWQGKLGERTIGSLGHPNVFATTALLCGLVLLHAAEFRRPGIVRGLLRAALPLAAVLAVMTYGRANWLALVVVTVGLAFVYPSPARRLVVLAVVAAALLLSVGAFREHIELAQRRFRSETSEESALSRLPVVYASFRLAAARPLVGWGYGNFDLVDRRFQAPVGNLVYPEKDHASHNVYLTILAEQGIVGLVLFLGPAVVWAIRSRSFGDRGGGSFGGRKLVGVLWLAIASHVTVNSFSNMHVEFGLGTYWVALGLIAVIVARGWPPPSRSTASRGAWS